MLVSQKFCLTTEQDGKSIGILDTFQVKFLHSREVVATSTHFVHTKNLFNMQFYRNFVPFGRSDSRGQINIIELFQYSVHIVSLRCVLLRVGGVA